MIMMCFMIDVVQYILRLCVYCMDFLSLVVMDTLPVVHMPSCY